ncbi:MAG: DcrB-related protein [Blastocatellia bacterium]
MPVYFVNEGTFELKDHWDDKSVTALTFPPGSRVPDASFSITRDPLKPTVRVSLSGYVDEQLSKLAKQCQQFELVKRGDATVAELPAELVEFTWKTPDGSQVHQLQVVLILPEEVFVLTGTASREKYPEFSGVFYDLIMSFRPRE